MASFGKGLPFKKFKRNLKMGKLVNEIPNDPNLKSGIQSLNDLSFSRDSLKPELLRSHSTD